MENEKKQIIELGIQAQKQKFEIRKELVGGGHDTTDFDEVYSATLVRLGLQEPIPSKVTFGSKTYIPPEFGGTGVKPPHINNGIRYSKVGAFFFVVIVLFIALIFAGLKFVVKTNPDDNEPLKWGKERVQDTRRGEGLSLGDEVLQTKVKAPTLLYRIPLLI